MTKLYYKVANPDGWDFYTGKTINYRENIGKTVKCPSKSKEYELCSSTVIHASKELFFALFYGKIPCSIYVVGGKPVIESDDKSGFKSLKIHKEINTNNWKQAYYEIMIYILQDVKNNFDNEKFDFVVNVINQTIDVFVNAKKTGVIDEYTAWSARYAADSAWSAARSAESARSAAWSAESARSAKLHEYSEKFVEYLEDKK